MKLNIVAFSPNFRLISFVTSSGAPVLVLNVVRFITDQLPVTSMPELSVMFNLNLMVLRSVRSIIFNGSPLLRSVPPRIK